MIYFLVIVACLGNVCQRHPVGDAMTMTACLSSSQIIAAQWAGDHPQHRIEAIRCELGKGT